MGTALALNKGIEEKKDQPNKENKEKEEQLKRSIERNDRLSILGEITAGIAHELNTPLGNILGFAELIKAAAKFEANQMTNKTIRECLNSRIAIDEMNDKELNDFQDDLITTFKYFNWLKDAKI